MSAANNSKDYGKSEENQFLFKTGKRFARYSLDRSFIMDSDIESYPRVFNKKSFLDL